MTHFCSSLGSGFGIQEEGEIDFKLLIINGYILIR